MIQNVSEISDLPSALLNYYSKKGWAEEEILESINDAIRFLNSLNVCPLPDERMDIPLKLIFGDLVFIEWANRGGGTAKRREGRRC